MWTVLYRLHGPYLVYGQFYIGSMVLTGMWTVLYRLRGPYLVCGQFYIGLVCGQFYIGSVVLTWYVDSSISAWYVDSSISAPWSLPGMWTVLYRLHEKEVWQQLQSDLRRRRSSGETIQSERNAFVSFQAY